MHSIALVLPTSWRLTLVSWLTADVTRPDCTGAAATSSTVCPGPKSNYWYCVSGREYNGCRRKSDGPYPEDACDEWCGAVDTAGVLVPVGHHRLSVETRAVVDLLHRYESCMDDVCAMCMGCVHKEGRNRYLVCLVCQPHSNVIKRLSPSESVKMEIIHKPHHYRTHRSFTGCGQTKS